MLLKCKPYRSLKLRQFIASFDCLFCEWPDTQCAHVHLRMNSTKAQKVHDYHSIPLCVERDGYKGCHNLFDSYRLFDNRREELRGVGFKLHEANFNHAKGQRILSAWRASVPNLKQTLNSALTGLK